MRVETALERVFGLPLDSNSARLLAAFDPALSRLSTLLSRECKRVRAAARDVLAEITGSDPELPLVVCGVIAGYLSSVDLAGLVAGEEESKDGGGGGGGGGTDKGDKGGKGKGKGKRGKGRNRSRSRSRSKSKSPAAARPNKANG
jgi:hypothetical protein